MPLNDQRILFAHKYVENGFNATQAAKDAGYSAKTAYVIGSKLLDDPETWAFIQGLTEDLMREAHMTAGELVRLISMRATLDVSQLYEKDGSLKLMSDIPEDIRRSIQYMEVVELFEGSGDQKHAIGLLRKVKLTDKDKNAEILAKHLGVIKERHVHENPDGTALAPPVINILPVVSEQSVKAVHVQSPDKP